MIFDKDYRLEDKYWQKEGRVFMTGIQALVRLPLMQRQLDQRNGLDTAGFISGYRGSPLGAYDQELWRSKKFLESHEIHFEPGINEDLGATAIWGTQLTDYYQSQVNKDGVFSFWYGKGHGVDRTADVFRQANTQGTSKHGGVLAFAGDDHTAESSMFPHQTDQVFEAAIMPILFPSSVEEFLTMGLAGIALSRYCGLWVAFKTITETVESGASFDLPKLQNFVIPEDFDIPSHGLNYDINLKWPAERMEYERRMIEERAPAAHAFAYANNIDKTIFKSPSHCFGIVTVGKAHGDLLEAFRILGISEQDLSDAGISIYKVGMSWPLEPRGIREFAEGMKSVLVIEEKRPQLEKQIKEQLYNWPASKRPAIYGKRDIDGRTLLPEVWAFTPEIVSAALSRWLGSTSLGKAISDKVNEFPPPCQVTSKNLLTREPYFCSGCPHNTSTKVPDGSMAGAGIGCHIMTLSMDRNTKTFTHMGGEGIHWVGLHRFSNNRHIFQNLGDGTYQHSGILAIRQALASKVNITYKILYNDAVAMTGGQPTEGEISPLTVAQQIIAEGVKRVALVSDDIKKYKHSSIPDKTEIFDREDFDRVQTTFREIAGVSAIIYDQTCAAEKRRRRKKGLLEEPKRRIYINDRVCEGCGDCSRQSNCISIEPEETQFGRKRKINQSNCNKDYSCVKGFCPSFVSVVGAEIREPDQGNVKYIEEDVFKTLKEAPLPSIIDNYTILVAGIGGTGVLTIGALLSMASHLEGKGATILDFTGLSQKNGGVVAHVKIANSPDDIHVPRILDGTSDLMLGCDMVAATPSIAKLGRGRSKAVINTAEVPVAEFTRNTDLFFPAQETKNEFITAIGEESVHLLNATEIAESLFGDSIATNLFMVGFAWQKSLIPLSRHAIEQAIRLNGQAVDFNLRAFSWGRLAADDIAHIKRAITNTTSSGECPSVPIITADERISFFYSELVKYQNQRYADRYLHLVNWIKSEEKRLFGSIGELTVLVAKYYYKIMAYKDEYEVARLYTNGEFKKKLDAQFQGQYKLQFHLAPPLLSRADKSTGAPRKMTFGPWVFTAFKVIQKLKFLRGTRLDPFSYTSERKMERNLINEYEQLVRKAVSVANSDNLEQISELLSSAEKIRGFGHIKESNVDQVLKTWETGLAALMDSSDIEAAA